MLDAQETEDERQARMARDDLLAALESKFCDADIELFQLVAERTLPADVVDAAASESADATRFAFKSRVVEKFK